MNDLKTELLKIKKTNEDLINSIGFEDKPIKKGHYLPIIHLDALEVRDIHLELKKMNEQLNEVINKI